MGFWKKMADELKEGFDIGKRIVQINNKMQKAGTTAVLTDEETQYHIGGLNFRRGGNGLYYFGDVFVENAACWALVSFIWGGPHYETFTTTTGTTRPKGKLTGAIIGGAVAGFDGAFVGALNGTHRHTDLKTTVQQVEKDTVAYLVFESVRTGERVQKQIRCNTKIAGQVGKLMG